MKEAVKYIVLVIGSFLSLIAAALAVSFAVDKNFQQMPLLLILPELVFIMFIITFILFIVWSFKFSNNQPHKKSLLTAAVSLALSFIVLIVSLQVNPIINKAVYSSASGENNNATPEQTRPVNSIPEPIFKYDLTSLLWSDNFDFTSLPSVDDEENGTIHDVYTITKTGGDDYTLHLEKDKNTEDIINIILTAKKTSSTYDFGFLMIYTALSLDEGLDQDDFVARTLNNQTQSKIITEEFDKFKITCSSSDEFINAIFTIK